MSQIQGDILSRLVRMQQSFYYLLQSFQQNPLTAELLKDTQLFLELFALEPLEFLFLVVLVLVVVYMQVVLVVPAPIRSYFCHSQ